MDAVRAPLIADVSQYEVRIMSSKSVGWESATAYDRFMGRWSRLAADEFLKWLDPPHQLNWFELGCGTGALTAAILGTANPNQVLAWEPSKPLLALAVDQITDKRVSFEQAGEHDLARLSLPIDVFASGLVLNFLNSPKTALEVIAAQLTPGALVAGYVWDYSEGMEFLSVFWDAATSLDPPASGLDQRTRYPLCAPDQLGSLLESVGLMKLEVEAIEIETYFNSFRDFWEPFLGGTGAAPTYIASLSPERRQQLEDALRTELFPRSGDTLELHARAWAVRGSC